MNTVRRSVVNLDCTFIPVKRNIVKFNTVASVWRRHVFTENSVVAKIHPYNTSRHTFRRFLIPKTYKTNTTLGKSKIKHTQKKNLRGDQWLQSNHMWQNYSRPPLSLSTESNWPTERNNLC